MPIYEYECTMCHHQFDLMQKINETPMKQCPECHQETAVRLVSAAGFQLKGTGWYATDFKNKDKPKETNKGSSTSSASETSDKKQAETKSQSKESSTKQGESD